MIHEVIVTTSSKENKVHIAPMGITMNHDHVTISPFKPSNTLDNLLSNGCAVINFTDDVRIFAGIVTKFKKDWPIIALNNNMHRLESLNYHFEVKVENIVENDKRPNIICKITNKEVHMPFTGFNRAQFSVIEASVLVSRLGLISIDKILNEIQYLKIGIDKTSGPREKEAWKWIEEKIKIYKEDN